MNKSENIKFGILGPGAIGSLIGTLINAVGYSVIFIGPEKYKNEIEMYGIQLKSKIKGDKYIKPRYLTTLNEPVDILFVTCKSYSIVDAIKRIPRKYIRQCYVIPLQNGLGHLDILKKKLPKNKIIAATIGDVDTERVSATYIKHNSGDIKIELALGDSTDLSKLNKLKYILDDSNITCEIKEREAEVIWAKLSRLSTLSSIKAASGLTLDKIFDSEYWYSILWNFAEEISHVSATQGFNISGAVIINQLKKISINIKTSLERDIESKKTNELENILGSVINLALEKNLNCQTLKLVHNLIINRIKNEI